MFSFFFNDTATTEIYTLSLHDALPICRLHGDGARAAVAREGGAPTCFEVVDVLHAFERSSQHVHIDTLC